jgi:Protein of unknown function (DUF2911)
MLRFLVSALLSGAVAGTSWGQQPSTDAGAQTATCSFQDGKQISVRYNNNEASAGKEEVPAGKVWTPGGQPMLLFTQAELSTDKAKIPVGAYSMYILRDRGNWTLVLNKNVSVESKYDKHQDLLRMGMLVGQLSQPEKQFSVVFGHSEPKQCNMRIYYGSSGTWAEFQER